jgi:hypothetical protein
MKSRWFFLLRALLWVFLGFSCIDLSAEAGDPQLNFIKSGKIPETEWLPYENYLKDAEYARTAWERLKPILARQLTFGLLKKRLGLDAKDLGFADGYENLGAIMDGPISLSTPIDKGGGRRWLVFQSTYGPLHSSTPSVLRRINSYITYDTLDQRIIRVTLAIVGEKSE